jgi:two-component system, NarL family, nitrate/nitrite response regulator NarL
VIRALIAGRPRVHGEALAAALSAGRRVQVLATASHPQEVLALLGEVTPDVVVLDFATPEAVAIVADIWRRKPNVKVVAVTLGESEAEVIQLAEAGVAGYVLPDGSLDDLTIAVESAARGELYCPPRVAFTLLRHLGAIAAALRNEDQDAAHSLLRALTPREREILQLVDAGMSNKAIARRLVIELATVKNHVHNILKKLHVHRRIEASAWYRQGAFHFKLDPGAGRRDVRHGEADTRASP